MIIYSEIGQSNNCAAKGVGANLALANQYLRLAGDGRIIHGRNASGNMIQGQEVDEYSRYQWNQASGSPPRYGDEGPLHDRLIARGVTEPVLFVPSWRGGLDSAEWLVNVAETIDLDTAPIQVLRQKLRYALSLTDARMGAIRIYQGESNATGTVGAGPAEWGTHWTTICNSLLAFVADLGGTWVHPTLRFIIVQLFATNPDPVTYPDWDAVRAAQVAFASGRSDCILVTAPNGPFNDVVGQFEAVHLEYGMTADEGQRGLGKLTADSLIDDFGLT